MTRGTNKDHCPINLERKTIFNGGNSTIFQILPTNASALPPSFRTFHHVPDSNLSRHLFKPSPSTSSIHESLKQPTKAIEQRERPRSEAGEMEARMFGLETPLMAALQHLLDVPDGEANNAVGDKSGASGPTRTYVRDARAMAATPADVKELPGAYTFVVDMPGLGTGDIKVQVEDERVLVISGERRREEREDAKYLRMERRMGKFMRKFVLPENADMDKISAVCRDGVLTVTVDKLPPPEPKKPKTIEVKVA
jgi:HSP20 family protein